MNTKEEIRAVPPYIPFSTFLTFIERLQTTALPPRIDTSVMTKMSGAIKSQLMSCLKFLGLIDAAGVVTDRLRNLIKTHGTEGWKDTFEQVVLESYSDIIGNLDLDSGTSAQLDERFRETGGVEGQMLDKAIRFFLAALQNVGVTYSPHFGTRKSNAKRRSRPKAAKSKDPTVDEHSAAESNAPLGTARFTVPIPGKSMATIIVPQNIEEHDWAMIDTMLRAYVGHAKRNQ